MLSDNENNKQMYVDPATLGRSQRINVRMWRVTSEGFQTRRIVNYSPATVVINNDVCAHFIGHRTTGKEFPLSF